MQFPFIEHEGKKFYQVGCKNCKDKGNERMAVYMGNDGWHLFYHEGEFLYKCKVCNFVKLGIILEAAS